MGTVTGVFQVSLQLQAESAQAALARVGRRSIEKQFEGPLSGASQGEMLSALTEVEGSMAYVALERFQGSLEGREGSFVLQHASLMERGQPTQNIVVVPDSGTGELEGLRGRMRIRIESGTHYYDFDYELPALV